MTILFKTEPLEAHGCRFPAFEVNSDKVTFVVGPSGSGKSTLFKLLNQTLIPESGTIAYLGQTIESINPTLYRREVMLVAQTVFLFDKTIEENFQMFFSLCEKKAPDQALMLRFLEICQADFALNTPAKNLSGGQRQRVYLAICLAMQPKVLLLDEPTSALDESTAMTVMSNIVTFTKRQGIALMAISHSDALMVKFAENHLIIGAKS